MQRSGVVEDCRIVVGAVAPTPLRMVQAEEILRGEKLTAELAAKIGKLVSASVHPISDIRASANLKDAEDFINLGASRLGTSRIVKAVKAMEG